MRKSLIVIVLVVLAGIAVCIAQNDQPAAGTPPPAAAVQKVAAKSPEQRIADLESKLQDLTDRIGLPTYNTDAYNTMDRRVKNLESKVQDLQKLADQLNRDLQRMDSRVGRVETRR